VADTIGQRKTQVGDEQWKEIIKFAYLSAIDNLWIDHLDAIDDMREGIGLRGYGQRDPLVEYKGEAFSMFGRLAIQIDSEFAKRLFRIQVGNQKQPQQVEAKPIEIKVAEIAMPKTPSTDFMSALGSLQKEGATNVHKKLGRNDPCWCGSKKKYKHCHYPN